MIEVLATLMVLMGLVAAVKRDAIVDHVTHRFSQAEQYVDGETVTLDTPTGKPVGAVERGQLGLGTILAAFVVVIAAFVVLIVVDQFEQSLGTPSSSDLSTAENDILSGFASMLSLVEPLLLIAIGVVIIGLIRRVQ